MYLLLPNVDELFVEEGNAIVSFTNLVLELDSLSLEGFKERLRGLEFCLTQLKLVEEVVLLVREVLDRTFET